MSSDFNTLSRNLSGCLDASVDALGAASGGTSGNKNHSGCLFADAEWFFTVLFDCSLLCRPIDPFIYGHNVIPCYRTHNPRALSEIFPVKCLYCGLRLFIKDTRNG